MASVEIGNPSSEKRANVENRANAAMSKKWYNMRHDIDKRASNDSRNHMVEYGYIDNTLHLKQP